MEIQQGLSGIQTTEIVTGILTTLHKIRTAVVKLETRISALHGDLLTTATFASPAVPVHVGIGNDIVNSDNSLLAVDTASNMITGDSRINIVDAPTTTRFTDSAVLLPNIDRTAVTELFNNLDFTFNQLVEHLSTSHIVDVSTLPTLQALDLEIGNDIITGSSGRDVITGDFTIISSPVITQCLVDSAIAATTQPCAGNFAPVDPDQIESLEIKSKVALGQIISNYLDDLVLYLNNVSHSNSYLRLEEDLGVRHQLIGNRGMHTTSIDAGRDQVNGGDGDDLLIGDSESFYHESILTLAEELLRLHDMDPSTSDIAGFDAILRRQFITTNTNRELFEIKTVDSQADNLAGQNGADAAFGQFGNDVLTGGEGVDALYGGSGVDIIEPPQNSDEEKTNSSDGSNHLDRQPLIDLQETNHLSSEGRTQVKVINLLRYRNQLTRDMGYNDNTGQVTRSNHATTFIAEDVNLDNLISPIDALMVVNYLNNTGSGALTSLNEHLNTNLDNAITPIDALRIINHLNHV